MSRETLGSDSQVEPRVLGQLLLVQSTLNVMPDAHGMARFVSRGLDCVPGVAEVTLCVEKTSFSARVTAAESRGQSSLRCENCASISECRYLDSRDTHRIPLQTVTRKYGWLIFRLSDPGRFLPYVPFLQNTANMVAMTVENRAQEVELRALNNDLEARIKARTSELRVLNDALAGEVRERTQAQESLAWEATLRAAEAELGQSLLAAGTMEEVSRLVLEGACRFTGSAAGSICIVEKTTGRLRCSFFSHGMWQPEAPANVVEMMATLVVERKPRIAAAGGPVAHAILVVPSLADGVVVAVIAVVSPLDAYTDRDLQLVERLFALFDLALQREGQTAEKRELAEQVQRAQRLESIGMLAGGIAHDFRNLLQIIVGSADMLLLEEQDGTPAADAIREIARAAGRGTELTQRLFTFSRKTELRFIPFDLNAVVREAARLLERTFPRMIRMEMDFAPEGERILGDPSRVEQVLVNLALNARDAMPQGGVLRLGTEAVHWERLPSATRADLFRGRYVALRVQDTGIGMDAETLRRVFEPFFTTKGVGQGTGLGLPVAYGIMKAHGGSLSCASEIGVGTTFSAFFPMPAPAEGDEAKAAPAALQVGQPGRQETVLVVDDEPSVRTLAAEMLRRSGYQSLTASSGEEALEVYRENRDSIALVLLDLNMPGMGGMACLESLLAVEPKVKIIVASGYSTALSSGEGAVQGAAAVLLKPYSVARLRQVVREVLEKDTT